MSGVKRTIDKLRERAEAGDADARATLEQAGLWYEDDGTEFDYYERGDYGGAVGPGGMIVSDADPGL
jgi:hypothetical protein